MALRIFNTLGRKLQEFVPLNPPRVGMYVCGPTVYSHSHLGHAKSYVSFDAMVRWLRYSGYQVYHVQNITDVGHMTNNDEDAGVDPIIREARQRGLHPMAIVDTYMKSHLEDMDAMNLLRPDIMPRATGHIPEQIECTKELLAKGHAYVMNGSVYFDVHSFAGYGRLSGRTVGELEAGARVAINEEKRHPADFALWKRAEPEHIMRWPSPWGEGFPGWHIECSVMSQKYLGVTLDIHGGGMENQFPHHECEIAQAESVTGQPFCRYWVHNNMVTLDGQKMGKSLGNAISLKQLFYEGHPLLDQTFDPVVVRHFILTSQYRSTLDFSNEALRGAQAGCLKLGEAVRELTRAAGAGARRDSRTSGEAGSAGVPPAGATAYPGSVGVPPARGPGAWVHFGPTDAVRTVLTDVEQRFTDAMNDDFNTAAAIAVTFELARHTGAWIREAAPTGSLLAADALMSDLVGDVLGLRWPDERGGAAAEAERNGLIQVLVDLRNEARKAKDFAQSDAIRQRLARLGIELKDGPGGTTW